MEEYKKLARTVANEITPYIINEHIERGYPIEYITESGELKRNLPASLRIMYALTKKDSLDRSEIEELFTDIPEYKDDRFRRVLNSIMNEAEK